MQVNKATRELALLNLARVFVDELRYINYPREWSEIPLSDVISPLFNVLNSHPAKLGDIVQEVFKKTSPKAMQSTINQLNNMYPQLFDRNRQYYVDMHDIEHFKSTTSVFGVNLSGELSNLDGDNATKRSIANLAIAIIEVFKMLTADQVDEHRTLERVAFAVTPVCYTQGLLGIGFDLSEYSDQWRTLDSEDRKRLATNIISRWS